MADSSASDALRDGLALHRRGAVAEAAARYAEVLRADPGNADAHYYLATIACQQGRFAEGADLARQSLGHDPRHARAHVLLGRALSALGQREEALASFERAVAIVPDLAPAHGHRADVLSELGRYAEAIESYDRALGLAPQAIEDWFNRGVALAALGRQSEAVTSFERAIAGKPDFAEAHLRRAKVLADLRRHDDALEGVDRALALAPDHAEAWLGRGNVLTDLKRYDEALTAYDRALALKADLAPAWLGRGIVLRELNRYDDALAGYERALALKPDLAEAWLGRGNVFFELKRYDDALAAYDRAMALKPDLVKAWHGRGNVFTTIQRYDEAFAAYDRALILQPDFAEAWVGRGYAFFLINRDAEALACFDKAISLDEKLAQSHFNKSLVQLTLGEYTEGWQLYEWRWKTRQAGSPNRNFAQPLWLGGSELAAKTILIHSEQGFGDTLQFFRYLPRLDEMNCKVVFESHASLAPLLRERNESIQIVSRGDALPHFDLQCPLMSLPLAFGTTLQTIPASIPYLFASQKKLRFWREALGPRIKPRVGLAWSGNADYHDDSRRSLPLKAFLGLLGGGVEWHSIQKDIRPLDREFLSTSGLIKDHSDSLNDFSDTAALVSELDLVISVDTAVAHLAGALGKKLWILLPFHSDFRWMREVDDSPWYPTAKLFRQKKDADWSEVLERMAGDLKAFLASLVEPA